MNRSEIKEGKGIFPELRGKLEYWYLGSERKKRQKSALHATDAADGIEVRRSR